MLQHNNELKADISVATKKNYVVIIKAAESEISIAAEKFSIAAEKFSIATENGRKSIL